METVLLGWAKGKWGCLGGVEQSQGTHWQKKVYSISIICFNIDEVWWDCEKCEDRVSWW